MSFDLPLSPSIPFGKYRGQSLQSVAERDSGYLRWMLTTDNTWATDNQKAIRDAIFDAQNAALKDLPPITVTPHQQEKVDRLLDWIDTGVNVVRLNGGAGYGKSYTVKKLLTILRQRRITAQACATSYVATQVLAKDLEPLGFETKTIAKTLKMSKTFVNGVEDYVLTADSALAAASLLQPDCALVVDECSMVSDEISQLLLDAAQRNGGTLILVGDQYQLPPVKQPTPSVLCLTPDAAELTEPMRYARTSDLFKVEQAARFRPREALSVLEGLAASQQVTRVRSQEALINDYVTRFREDPLANHRMLLFRRTDVVEANNRIRASLHGPDASIVVDGEKLMILRTSDTPWRGPQPMQGETTRYYSGESFYVTHAVQDTHPVEVNGHFYDIPHWRVTFQDRPEPVRVIFAITETTTDPEKLGGPEFQAALSAAVAWGRQTNDWLPWRQLQSDFVSVAYQYSTSIHRCQGQTADYAYVVPGPLLSVRGIIGPALSYVALTRARKHLTVKL